MEWFFYKWYYVVNRRENQIHHDKGKKIDPNLFGKNNDNITCEANYIFLDPNEPSIYHNS